MSASLADYDFDLPEDQIAQEPPAERAGGRLLAMERASGTTSHHRVVDLPSLLRGDELVVVNDTRVAPARLHALKPTGGRVELLATPPDPDQPPDERWCLFRTAGSLRDDTPLHLASAPEERLHVIEVRPGRVRVRATRPFDDVTSAHGQMPLPPYIRRAATDADAERYQTLFSASSPPRSVAAPTAGLHFDPTMLERIDARGVPIARVTLHVGPGTFQPVRADDLRAHAVEPEWSSVPDETATAIAQARRDGRRVLAVGTTTVRTLEGWAAHAPDGAPATWRNGLTIRPGYEFRVVEALFTNFHLPRSSLLVLVATFGGREPTLAAYRTAVDAGYRFYSYGDAMLVR